MAAGLLASALGAGCAGGGGRAGDPLPDVDLESLDGGAPLRLADVGDGPVVVNLWATWCGPCRAEMPAFDEVDRALGGKVRVVGVNVGDDPGAARRFVDDVGVGFPQYLDRDGTVHTELGATGMPATAFVDDGQVLDLHTGALGAGELRDRIERQLGVTVPAGPAPAGNRSAPGDDH